MTAEQKRIQDNYENAVDAVLATKFSEKLLDLCESEGVNFETAMAALTVVLVVIANKSKLDLKNLQDATAHTWKLVIDDADVGTN